VSGFGFRKLVGLLERGEILANFAKQALVTVSSNNSQRRKRTSRMPAAKI
jgi:hypothetical protein